MADIDVKSLSVCLHGQGLTLTELEGVLGRRIGKSGADNLSTTDDLKATIWNYIRYPAIREAVKDVKRVFPKARLEVIR